MAKPLRILGIDLGGCMSGNSAYIFAEVGSDGIRVIEAVKEPKHKEHRECEAYFVSMLTRHEVDAIAVDAPLSLPRPLYDAAFEPPPREGEGEIVNPYLYRYTDYWLYRTYGLKPMPPAGDRIGRLTARMVALLRRVEYRFPTISLAGRRIPFYEDYPKQVAHALAGETVRPEAGASEEGWCFPVTRP